MRPGAETYIFLTRQEDAARKQRCTHREIRTMVCPLRRGFAACQLFGALARLSVLLEWNWTRQLKGKLPSSIQYGWGALPNKG